MNIRNLYFLGNILIEYTSLAISSLIFGNIFFKVYLSDSNKIYKYKNCILLLFTLNNFRIFKNIKNNI